MAAKSDLESMSLFATSDQEAGRAEVPASSHLRKVKLVAAALFGLAALACTSLAASSTPPRFTDLLHGYISKAEDETPR